MELRSAILAVARERVGDAVLDAWGLSTAAGSASPVDAHDFLGQRLLARRDAGWVWEPHQTVARRYELQYGLAHLEEAGKSDVAREVHREPAFLDQLTGESLRCTRDGDIERAAVFLSRTLAGYTGAPVPIGALRACRFLGVRAYEKGARQLGSTWFQHAIDLDGQTTDRLAPVLKRRACALWAEAETHVGNLELAESLLTQACANDSRYLVELTETRARLRRWGEVLKTAWPADMDVLSIAQLLMLRCEARFACGETPQEDGQRMLQLLKAYGRPDTREPAGYPNLRRVVWLLDHIQDFPGRGVDGGACLRLLCDLLRHRVIMGIVYDDSESSALEEAAMCVSRAPRHPSRDACLWALQVRRAQWLHRAGRSEEAIALCNEVLREVPSPPETSARRLMAALLFSLRDSAPALREPLLQILNGFLPPALRRATVSEAHLRQAVLPSLAYTSNAWPLSVNLSGPLAARVDPNQGQPLFTQVGGLRSELAQRFGFRVSGVRFRDDLGLADGDYTVTLHGRLVAEGNVGRLPPDGEGDRLVIDTLRRVMLQYLPEVMQRDETVEMLIRLRETHPGHAWFAWQSLGIEHLTSLLQALLRRGVPVGNLPRIVELAGHAHTRIASEPFQARLPVRVIDLQLSPFPSRATSSGAAAELPVEAMVESIEAGLRGHEMQGWHVEFQDDGTSLLGYEVQADARVPPLESAFDEASREWLIRLLARTCRDQNRIVQNLALEQCVELMRPLSGAPKRRAAAALLGLTATCVVRFVRDAIGSHKRSLARPFATFFKRKSGGLSKR